MTQRAPGRGGIDGAAATRVDVLLVGGGLANALIAWRLARERPGLSFAIVEAESRLGGNHTWCCHGGDLSPDAARWLAPLVAHRWPGYDVRFVGHARRFDGGYLALTSTRLHEALAAELPPAALRLGRRVRAVDAAGATLDDGERLDARVVVDGRGWRGGAGLDVRFQKFVGVELEFAGAHGVERPLLMDATVPQLDGYRFLYVLPLGARRLLVEDTRYSDGAALDDAALRDAALAYARERYGAPLGVIREERGVLPVALRGDLARYLGPPDGVARVGLAGGLFHPTTGYSLPDAVRVADRVAAHPLDDGPALAAEVRAHALELWRSRGFFRLLNRMLFEAAVPAERHRVMERFYRLDAGLIGRFYADRLRFRDRVRVLTGKPPVPIANALACVAERRLSRPESLQ